jgi:glycosyltransferase involved in cell wall biosynthesis
MPEKRKKIAIVVQRYGVEVNGGAEFHARILAEKLAQKYEVEILTSTAINHHGWENHYQPGESFINEIKVHRFPTFAENKRKTRAARRAIFKKKKYFKILKFLGIFKKADQLFNLSKVTETDVEAWLRGQGPHVPDLVQFISAEKDNYNVFIFFTYLYYPTVVGMPLVAEKSIFIPTAHDEPVLYTKPYENLFSVPKFIMYNTESEKQLIENNFRNIAQKSEIAGVGISPFAGEKAQLPAEIIPNKYFIYIGRIESAKGCDLVIHHFLEFQKKYPKYSEFKLVLVGKNHMKKTYHNSAIIYTGFVSEELKHAYLANALALIMPSFYESLSMVTLEAMVERKPVIVNGICSVLKSHIDRSGSGKSYTTKAEFFQALQYYIGQSETEREIEAEKARKYVLENYSWKSVLQKFDEAIEFVTKS